MTNSALGRGLSSLIPSKSVKEKINGGGFDERIYELDTDSIVSNTHQPRQNFDRQSLEDLINSIKVHGIIQPLVVIKSESGYQLIAGERRLRAAKFLKMKKVPVVVRTATNQQKLEIALVENVQRQNLNAMEKAFGYRRLIEEFKMTQEEVGKKVGQSRAAVANTLRLLSLPEEIKTALREEKLTEGHAKALLAVSSPAEQKRIFREILSGKLSVRAAESAAKKVTVRRHIRQTAKDPNLKEKEERLMESLGTKVEISRQGGRGTITVHFYSGEELREIIKKITE